MKILYVTDLHGIEWKFDKIYNLTKLFKPDVVINGGDMLPFRGNLLHQNKFITNFLDDYFSKFEAMKIYYLGLLGNDDLIIFDELFQETCDKSKYIENIAQTRFQIVGSKYEFIGMNWVTDLPFGLKDRARKDTTNFKHPKQIGKQYLSSTNGWKKLEDWFSYAENLPTIKDEINKLVKPFDMNNAIYIIHNPPSHLSLDVCYDARKVGSRAIYDFLEENQPKISFHGHIHESPDVSGKWYSYLKRTLCIQPGQSHQYENYLTYVLADLETMNFNRKVIEKDQIIN
ncbi:MAG: metallophosphoesterase [Candidatus Heimdallarchaeota archaeon]